MKKTILTLAFFLCAFFAAKSQSILADTLPYSGDSLKVYFPWHSHVPATDTATAQLEYKSCGTCMAFPDTAVTVFTDSLDMTTVWKATTAGTYFVAMKLTIVDTAGVTTQTGTVWYPVTVSLPWAVPTISFAGPGVGNPTGGSQMLTGNSGNTISTIRKYIDPDDTTYQTPHVLVHTWTITGGAFTINDVTDSLADGTIQYPFSQAYSITNSKGFDSIQHDAIITTLVGGAPWIALNADSSALTDSTAYVQYQGLTNGAACTGVIKWRKVGSSVWQDSVVQSFPANPSSVIVEANMSSLMADSSYQRQAVIYSQYGTAVSNITTWTMPSAPQNFSLTTTVDYFNGGSSEMIQGTLVLPVGTATVLCALTKSTDQNFTSGSVVSTSFVQYNTPGVYYPTASFDNLVNGMWYRAMYYGNDDQGNMVALGQNGPNMQVVFQFRIPTDSVPPTATLELQYEDANDIAVTFSGNDNDSLAGFILSDNGVAHTLAATVTSYTFSHLAPSSVHHISLQAFDEAGLYSTLDTLTITTDATSSIATAATIASLPDSVCEIDTVNGGGWNLIDVYGTNFASGATYDAAYQSGGPDDVDTIHYITPTHCKVWLWVSYYDVITYTITNPGANPSNSLQTQVVDCGSTGIAPVTRLPRNLLSMYPNPVRNVTTVEVGQNTPYSVYNLLGTEMCKGKFVLGQNTINLQALPDGMYFIHTATGYSLKFIKLKE
jgi:hypothetical protein